MSSPFFSDTHWNLPSDGYCLCKYICRRGTVRAVIKLYSMGLIGTELIWVSLLLLPIRYWIWSYDTSWVPCRYELSQQTQDQTYRHKQLQQSSKELFLPSNSINATDTGYSSKNCTVILNTFFSLNSSVHIYSITKSFCLQLKEFQGYFHRLHPIPSFLLPVPCPQK